MNILLSLGFEGGEETGRPIPSPPPPPPPPQNNSWSNPKNVLWSDGLEVADQFYFLDKY